jgi:hypothetical protein
MVALNEQSYRKSCGKSTQGKRRHRKYSVASIFQKSAESEQSTDRFLVASPKNPPRASAASVVKFSHQRSNINDQKKGIPANLFIANSSLLVI